MHELVAAADSIAVVQGSRLNVAGHHNVEGRVWGAVWVFHVQVVATDASVKARFFSFVFASRLFNHLSVQIVFVIVELVLVFSIVSEVFVHSFAWSPVLRAFLRQVVAVRIVFVFKMKVCHCKNIFI